MNFLFWNLNKKRLEGLVADLAELHELDVLILVECEIPIHVMLTSLNRHGEPMFHRTPSQSEKIVIYTRFSPEFLVPLFESTRLTVRRLRLPEQHDVLLAAVHLPDKLHWSAESQSAECVALASAILSVEKDAGHARTVLVGDFNMNPFEAGLVMATGVHAVMTRALAERGQRVVQERKYPFFYNPMWGHFGDTGDSPAGTYYYRSSEHVAYFWNMFDQVLIRPALLSMFRNEELKILSAVGDKSLITTRGVPNRAVGSDHLPILFRLDL